MPRLVNLKNGNEEWVHPDNVDARLQSGNYAFPDVANVLSEGGAPSNIPGEQVELAEGVGYEEATPEAVRHAQVKDAAEAAKLQALLEGAASTILPGIAPLYLKTLHGGTEGIKARAETTAGQIGKYGGYLAPVGAPGAMMKAGKAVRGALPGIGGAVAAGAAEGAILGGSELVNEATLSDDPLTAEHVMSTLTTNMILGGGVGGGIHMLSKAASAAKGLAKVTLGDETLPARLSTAEVEAAGKQAIDDAIAASPKHEALWQDFMAVRERYRGSIKAFSRLREIGKEEGLAAETSVQGRKAARMLGGTRDRPFDFTERPAVALNSLQMHNTYLRAIQEQTPQLRLKLAKAGYGPTAANPSGGVRWQKLDEVPDMIRQNEDLIAKITQADALPKKLASIEKSTANKIKELEKQEARELVEANKPGLGTKVLQALVFGGVTKAAFPVVGMGAPLVGGWAAKMVGRSNPLGALSKKLSNGVVKTAERGQGAIKAFMNAGAKLARATPLLTSKALQAHKFALDEEAEGFKRGKELQGRSEPLRRSHEKRVAEIKSQITFDPMTMGAVMRQDKRLELGQKLLGVRAISPGLADKMESVQARKIEFLANKLTKNTGMPGWQPSKADMARDARYMEAAENPLGVIDRMSKGQLWPEDVETMQAVYPELYAYTTNMIMSAVAKIGGVKKLPLWKRVMLSMFTMKPLEPSLQPNILSYLQNQFAAEPGTEGGVVAPPPQPNFGSFGSVSADEDMTPAQELASS